MLKKLAAISAFTSIAVNGKGALRRLSSRSNYQKMNKLMNDPDMVNLAENLSKDPQMLELASDPKVINIAQQLLKGDTSGMNELMHMPGVQQLMNNAQGGKYGSYDSVMTKVQNVNPEPMSAEELQRLMQQQEIQYPVEYHQQQQQQPQQYQGQYQRQPQRQYQW